LVERIRRRFDSRRVYWVGGVQIKETATGYEALEPGQDTPIQLTNFVIELDASVWFEASDEIFFTGRVILNGSALPFLIAQEELEQAKLIRRAAQRALNRQAMGSALPLPSIAEPGLQAKLVSLLAQQLGEKPRRLGVERLGWNEAKTRFVSPAWHVQSSGVQPTSGILHPSSTQLASHFRCVEPVKEFDGTKASPQGRQLIAALAALLTRAFLNEQTPAVKLRRSPEALALLQAVFRPLGQVAAVELSAKPHEAEQTLGKNNFWGYPLYATAPQGAQLDRINYPLLLLSESGFPLTDRLDNQAREHTSSLSYRVLSALVLSLVREGSQVHGWSRSQTATTWQDLLQEGKRLIEARCGLGQFDLLEPQSPLLFQILAQIAPEQLRAYFHQERAGDNIRVLCRKLQGVTRQPLYQELVAQNPGVKPLGDHYILCPTEWFRPLLEHYYGVSISLPLAKASADLTQAQTPT